MQDEDQKYQELSEQWCIWMEAGVLNYKLCDFDFDCDRCPLDIALRMSTQKYPTMVPCGKEIDIEIPLPDNLDESLSRLLSPYSRCSIHPDLLYSKNHQWVRMFHNRLATIGLDSFFTMILPYGAQIILSSLQTPLEQGKPFGWVYVQNETIPILAPLSGSSVRINHDVEKNRLMLSSTHYDLNWLVLLSPSDIENERKYLLHGEESGIHAKKSLQVFMDNAICLLQGKTMLKGILMNDGGIPAKDLEEALGEKEYFELFRDSLRLHHL